MMGQQDDNQQKQTLSIINLMMTLTGQIGCLTLLILIGAAFLGRWLDAMLNTGRTATLWLILGSLPLSLLLMYGLIKLTLNKTTLLSNAQAAKEPSLPKREEE